MATNWSQGRVLVNPSSSRNRKRAGLSVQLVAAHVLRDVVDQARSLDRVIESKTHSVAPELKPSLMELAYGSCRHYYQLDGILSRLLVKPIRRKDRMVHFLLIVGLYQLIYMRVPDHAAVDETVRALETSKQSWARGLVNGVLRNYARKREGGSVSELISGLPESVQASFPRFLFDAIRNYWTEHADAIFSASICKPPMTLRVNCQKTTREDYLALLDTNNIEAAPTQESNCGINLHTPLPIERIPMFSEGWVSVQDESAQLCTLELDLIARQRVLDACAAPGGKACAILETEPSIDLTAVDLPERVEAIRQNLIRIGLDADLKDTGLEEYADWWDGEVWDRILLDVPCSGTGVIRRHPDILHRRQQGDFQRFAGQQLNLLEDAWPMLAQGGLLLYVTCSIIPVENDEVVGRFLKLHPDASIQQIKTINGLKTDFGIQRLPGVHSGDGFYYCRLVKL